MKSKMFKRRILIFFILMVVKWQLLAVEADEEADRAVADLSEKDLNLWNKRIIIEDVVEMRSKCYKLMLNYIGMETFIAEAYSTYETVTGRHVGNINKGMRLLCCAKSNDTTYYFGPGSNATMVVMETELFGNETKYVPQKVLREDFKKWKYIYDFRDGEIRAVCIKILDAHHPLNKNKVAYGLRAVRNGIDENVSSKRTTTNDVFHAFRASRTEGDKKVSTRRFMTLICYYDSQNYYEYCEGSNDYEVFQVTYSKGIYRPILSTPINVKYQLSQDWF